MGRVVVIGERTRVAGFALVGADVRPADDVAALLAAWPVDDGEVAVVVLTSLAAQALGPLAHASPAPSRPLVVVLP